MKISNETKIGALTAIAVTLLVLGFNFLKGKTMFKSGFFVYAKYGNAKKLVTSNPVLINGFEVGNVNEIETDGLNLGKIVVTIKFDKPYNIPDNSVASIEGSLLGVPNMNIKLGSSNKYLKSGDTIMSADSKDLLDDFSAKFDPVTTQLKATMLSLDSVLKNVNTIFDPRTKGNLQSIIANLNTASAGIVVSTASLQKLLNAESGALTASLNNVNSFTKNLADNNDRIDSVLANMQTATGNLSKADIDGTVNQLKASINKLNDVMAKINSQDGTLGSLINSKELYNNINNTLHSLNILVDDLRVHPKRYVNISVFGKKDKGDYLTAPLTDSSNSSSPKK